MTQKRYRIAIDGVSASGKSTIAKGLAKKLNYIYIDTGAMYRAVTLKILSSHTDIEDKAKMDKMLRNTHIHFENNEGLNNIYLDGKNVEKEIRTLKVSDFVSEVAKIDEVRKFLVDIQKNYAIEDGVVMDGRDIATVVMPDADFKFFITANIEIRALRRMEELALKSESNLSDEVLSNLKKRDHIDSTRENSPLQKSEDSIEIDTSNMTKEEQLNFILRYIENSIKSI